MEIDGVRVVFPMREVLESRSLFSCKFSAVQLWVLDCCQKIVEETSKSFREEGEKNFEAQMQRAKRETLLKSEESFTAQRIFA